MQTTYIDGGVNDSRWLTFEHIHTALRDPRVGTPALLRAYADEAFLAGATSLSDELREYADQREVEAVVNAEYDAYREDELRRALRSVHQSVTAVRWRTHASDKRNLLDLEVAAKDLRLAARHVGVDL